MRIVKSFADLLAGLVLLSSCESFAATGQITFTREKAGGGYEPVIITPIANGVIAFNGSGGLVPMAQTSLPISTATQTALDLKAALVHSHTSSQISDLSEGGNGEADAGLGAKFMSSGQLQASQVIARTADNSVAVSLYSAGDGGIGVANNGHFGSIAFPMLSDDDTSWRMQPGGGYVPALPNPSDSGLLYRNSTSQATLVHAATFFPETYGAVGDGTTDDSNAIQAAIDAAVAVQGTVSLGSKTYKITYTMEINGPMTLCGDGVHALFGDRSVAGSDIFATEAPYLQGSVLLMTTAGADAIKISAIGRTVQVRDLGVRFSDAIKFTDTGHGINCDPGTYLTGSNNGLDGGSWRSIYIYGVDGDHYAYRMVNAQLMDLRDLHCYGGGGLNWHVATPTGWYGNSTISNFYACHFVGGTSHGIALTKTYSGHAPIYLNFVRPQVFGYTGVSGAANPTSDQWLFWATDDIEFITWSGPDFETSGAHSRVHLPDVLRPGHFLPPGGSVTQWPQFTDSVTLENCDNTGGQSLVFSQLREARGFLRSVGTAFSDTNRRGLLELGNYQPNGVAIRTNDTQRLLIDGSGNSWFSGRATVTYDDNSYNGGITIRNTNTGSSALPGMLIQDSSGTAKAQAIYVPSNFINGSLADTYLLNSVGNVKLGFVADSTGVSQPDLYFKSGPNVLLQLFGATANVSVGSTSDSGDRLFVNGTARAAGVTRAGVYTVGTLPTASSYTYYEAVVTDATSPTVGATVSSGGSAKAKVMSNGSNWIVTATL
ncbi:MAG: glycosyl hydrolase family 28-related protein [Luteolibacter sp.]